ncbi:MAG: peptidoglycan-binding protein [Clostridia bacterium]|nr:peptidoglycan-binding protein [Clostridia bacterium]
MIELKQGDRGAYVQMLQLALKRAGADIKTDGIFGEDTYLKLREFQSQNGIEPSGIADDETWELLTPYLRGYRLITVQSDKSISEISEEYGIDLKRLKISNPELEDIVPAETVITIPFDFDIVPTDINYTWELVKYVTDGISKVYPFVKLESIGKSVMGKDLYVLKIGEGETEVFYNAEHHANEWITTPLLLKFAEEYSKCYSDTEEICSILSENLYRTKTLYILPSVNPDGMDLVNGVIPVGEEYNRVLAISKNYPDIKFPEGWKANILGVDLNLNYPAGWNNAKKIKYDLGFVSPAPRDFVGETSLSEPESQAVYDFTNDHDFSLTMSYHSQGNVIYWKYLDYNPENSYKIAQKLSEVSGYNLELTPTESGYAGYKDWFIQAYNRPGYTIEVGEGESPLPLSEFDEIYGKNIEMLIYALEMA